MAFILVLQVAILTCIFLGILLAIIATAGKEWENIKLILRKHLGYGTFAYTVMV